MAAIAAAFVVIPADLGAAAVFTMPTKVDVLLDSRGEADLFAATNCSDPDGTRFHAVGGTWTAPELAVDGADCTFDARWWPAGGTFEILPAP